jgi:energy-coupling factor transporter transmembrane protein EcfT
MAQLTLFSYLHGHSLLHGIDVRFKILGLLLISLVSLNVGVLSLTILSALLVFLVIDCRLGFKAFLREIRYFLFLMLIILLAHALSAKGTIVFRFYFLTVSVHGLYDGVLISWRLFLVVLVGLLFVSTTRPSQIKAAVEWFLNPVPFVSGKRLATMLSLVMRFIPVILNQARETTEAQKARCVENRKNPVYRIIKFAIPMIRCTFETAEELAVAMEARCYSENRTQPEFTARFRDWMVLMVSVCLFLLGRIY